MLFEGAGRGQPPSGRSESVPGCEMRRGFPREGGRAFQAQKWPAQRSEEGGQGRVRGQETLQLWKKLEMCAGLRGTGLWLPGKAFVLSKAQGESLKRDWVVVRAEVGGMG